MKVISGTLKGRVIPTLKTHDYRPTLSRIREDVFNLIQHNNKLNVNLEESTFGDLFCGTGSIGIEALSRGAQKVIFNDLSIQNINTLKIFLKNIPNDNYEIHQTDIFKHSESLIENCDKRIITVALEFCEIQTLNTRLNCRGIKIICIRIVISRSSIL